MDPRTDKVAVALHLNCYDSSGKLVDEVNLTRFVAADRVAALDPLTRALAGALSDEEQTEKELAPVVEEIERTREHIEMLKAQKGELEELRAERDRLSAEVDGLSAGEAMRERD